MTTDSFITFAQTLGFELYNAWKFKKWYPYLTKSWNGEFYIMYNHNGMLLSISAYDNNVNEINLHYMAKSNNGIQGQNYLLNAIDTGGTVKFCSDGIIVFNNKRITDIEQLQTHIDKLFENSVMVKGWKSVYENIYFCILDDNEYDMLSKLSFDVKDQYSDACTIKHILEGDMSLIKDVMYLIYGDTI